MCEIKIKIKETEKGEIKAEISLDGAGSEQEVDFAKAIHQGSVQLVVEIGKLNGSKDILVEKKDGLDVKFRNN